MIYLVRLFFTGLLCFTVFRIMLFIQEYQQLQNLPENGKIWLVVSAFITGLRFDILTSFYILAIPFLLLSADALGNWNSKLIYRTVALITSVSYVAAFFVCAGDLPFMHHFHTRANISAFISVSGGSSEFLKGMVFQEWRYFWAIAPFLLMSFFVLRKQVDFLQGILFKTELGKHINQKWIFPLFFVLLFIGIWGQLSLDSPIDTTAAYTSDYSFTNQLGLNPAYTMGLSFWKELDKGNTVVHFADDQLAIRFAQQAFNIPDSNKFSSPLAREVIFPVSAAAQKPNVVLVIMESMSANKMGRYGNPHHLTPFMDSLATRSYAFDSVFTTGIHTFAGIYSVLFSQPVIKMKHPMLHITPQSGIANTLQSHGYSTIYFTTHDEAFDNVGPYLKANGFERIVAKPEYPKERVYSSLGVSDDYLYEHATAIFDEMYARGSQDNKKPFFAAIMTGSDHGPYIIPPYFKPKQEKATLAIVEYVDWSVRQFLEKASKKEWFDNTIFVFVADHGASLDKRYDLPLTYLHTPLLIYAPKILGEPKSLPNLGSQVDIFPTLMGMLQLSYVNNTFGIDLLREKRDFAISYADDKYGVLNGEYMFLARDNGLNSLYRYKSGGVKDESNKQKELTKAMKSYGENMFQAAQWMFNSGHTGQVPLN